MWGGACSCDVFSDGNGNRNTANADCSGTITATFTWQGDDPTDKPPKTAVVTQYCDASWQRDVFGDAVVSGSCTNPLGGSSVPAYYSDGTQSGADWTYTLYTAKTDPGPSFSVTCAPGANAGGSGGSGTSSSYGVGTASVSYTALAQPVIVVPKGYTVDPSDHSWKLLTSQPLSATLNAPYSIDPNSYQWSATGDVFYTYNEHAPNHQLILLSDDPSYTNQPQFGLYDKAADTITITCKAVVVCLDGTRLPVTGISRDIASVKPQTNWGTNQSATGVGFSDDPANQEFEANELWYPINITVPSPFSGGSGCIAQLVTASRRIARHAINGKPSNYYNAVNQPNPDGSANWVLPGRGLDTHFPYQVGASTDAGGTTTLTTIPDGYVWDAGTTGASGDTPKQPYEADDLDGGGTDWYESSAADSFSTWVMYRYPGGVWVPLQKLDWGWSGIETKDTYGHWSPSGIASAPNPPTDSSDPPQWNSIVTGGGFHPVGSN